MASTYDQVDADGKADAIALARLPHAIGDTRACPDCERPQHYTGTEHGWAHDALIATWECADPAKAGA